MKLKPKKFKKKKAKAEEAAPEYPEEYNPFCEEAPLNAEEDGKKKKKKKKKQIANGEVLKGKTKKIKKEKKVKEGKVKTKKLKGKRERAVSKAVVSHLNEDKVLQDSGSVANGKSFAHAQQGENANETYNRLQPTLPLANDAEKDSKTVAASEAKAPGPKGPVMKKVKAQNKIPNQASSGKASKVTELKKMKRPSEGDIKSLRTASTITQNNDAKNPFETAEDLKEESTQAARPPALSKTSIQGAPMDRERGQSRRRRTSSMVVSSRERGKKKRLRLVKKWKRQKKKNKKLTQAIEEESERSSLGELNVNPKPAKAPEDKTEELRRQVDEVSEIVSTKVAENLARRHSGLSQLLATTGELEDFAHSFATMSHETRLKKQAQARCCGMFSRHRICWYICACERRLKKKKQKTNPTTNNQAESTLMTRAYADQVDDTGDAYEIQEQQPGTSAAKTGVRMRKHKRPNHGSTASDGLLPPVRSSLVSNRSSASSLLFGIQNARLLQNLKRSSLTTEKIPRRKIGERKYSSTGDLQDLLNRQARISKNVELGIREVASEFEDAEMRKRAAELLLLDHEESD